MARLEQIYGYFDYIKRFSIFLSGIAIFGMIILITLDVLSRNILSSSIPGSYEIVRNYLMTLAAFPIILYAYSSGIMPRISMVVERLPRRVQKPLNIILLLFEIFITGLITYYSFGYAVTGTLGNHAFPAAGNLFPIYPFQYLVPFGFGCLIVEMIFVLTKNCLSKGVWITFNNQQEKSEGQDSPHVS